MSTDSTGVRWSEFAAASPDLAGSVRERFAAHPHHVVATLASDGSPRLNGTNVYFTDGMLWFGTMRGAVRALDLARDPRVGLHSAPLNEQLPAGGGDARVSGTARRLPDPEGSALLVAEFGAESAGREGEFFEVLLRSVSLVEVHGNSVVVRWWSPSTGEQVRLRG